jgi:hypothetical protein
VSLPDRRRAAALVECAARSTTRKRAAEHMRAVTRLMREQGVARDTAPAVGPAEELPIEEWVGMEEDPPADPMAELLEEVREDVERVVEGLDRKAGSR